MGRHRPAERLAPGLHVKVVLAAEVVVDGGDVGPGPLADLRHRGVVVALLGKGEAGGVQEPFAGIAGFARLAGQVHLRVA